MPTDGAFIEAIGKNKPEYSAFDVSSKHFWNSPSGHQDELFARLRREDPVSWQRPVEDAVSPDPNDPGYWAVVRHAEIASVSRDHRTYISSQGVQFDLLPPSVLEMSQSFLAMDPPRHQYLRRLVSAAFTRKRIHSLDEQIRTAAREVVDDFAYEDVEIDFVARCGRVLPTRLFSDMFGIPTSLRETVHKAAGNILAWADHETLEDRAPGELQMQACGTLHDVAAELAGQRRYEPSDDLLTDLAHAEVDGRRLDDAEIGAFFTLMSVAATDTTKHTAAWVAKALSSFPDQREWLRCDYDGRINSAVEEFIRYASPVMTFRRTAATNTRLGDRTILPGDKIVMFYLSGNRDPKVFADPERFDLSRDPNPHVGFGGGGIHYCLGAHLAKGALRELFRQLLTRIPDFEAGEPDLLGTNFMRGVKRLPFRFTSEKRRHADRR